MKPNEPAVLEIERNRAIESWPELATVPEDYARFVDVIAELVESGETEKALIALRLLRALLQRIGRLLQSLTGDAQRRVQEILVLRERLTQLEHQAITGGESKEPVH